MVCVAVKGKPVIGVIHKPFSDKTYWAWLGKTHSDNLIDVKKNSADPSPSKINVIVSMSHGGGVEQTLKEKLGEDIKITHAAGSGYKVLEVASGNASAYFHKTEIKKWDICAGNALLNALGGRMTTRMNEEIDYSNEGIVVNDKGILATLNNHDWYAERLKED